MRFESTTDTPLFVRVFSCISRLNSNSHSFWISWTANNANGANEGLFFLHGSRFHPRVEGKPSPWTLPRTAFNLQGTLPFLFAVFVPFAVRIYNGHSVWISWTANNANGTNKEKQTYKLSRFSRLSRLNFQWTRPLNSLNREQREGYEQIPADTPYIFLPSLAGTALELQGTLHFSDVRSYKGHSGIESWTANNTNGTNCLEDPSMGTSLVIFRKRKPKEFLWGGSSSNLENIILKKKIFAGFD